MGKPDRDIPEKLKHEDCLAEADLIGWKSDHTGVYACNKCKCCFLENGTKITRTMAFLFAQLAVPAWFYN